MYKLATHNSMSYLKPYWWVLRPFAWMAHCQSRTITQQLQDGITVFDFRIKSDKKGEMYFQHGLCRYSFSGCYKNMYIVLRAIDFYAYKHKTDIYIRLTLEILTDDKRQIDLFKKLCEDYKNDFDNITFYGGNAKYNWTTGEKIFDFGNDSKIDPYITERFRSRYHKTIFPWFWAKKDNKKYKQQEGIKEYLMLDFYHKPKTK